MEPLTRLRSKLKPLKCWVLPHRVKKLYLRDECRTRQRAGVCAIANMQVLNVSNDWFFFVEVANTQELE
jgi:hypothetical protein